MKTEVKPDSQKLNRTLTGVILYRKLNTKEFEVIQLWFSKIWFKIGHGISCKFIKYFTT